jgi:hypothetical protein
MECLTDTRSDATALGYRALQESGRVTRQSRTVWCSVSFLPSFHNLAKYKKIMTEVPTWDVKEVLVLKQKIYQRLLRSLQT